MIEVIDIGIRKRWEGLVIPLEIYKELVDMSFGYDGIDRENFWFDVYENQGITFDPKIHVIVEL
jgi:hypothetical protein